MALLVIIGSLVGGGGSRNNHASEAGTTAVAPTDVAEAEPSSVPDSSPVETNATLATDAGTTTTQPGAKKPVAGDVIELDGGAVARLNVVQPQAPPLNEFITPKPGMSFTRLDVEQCAGETPLSMNPLYWSAQLDDNTMAEPTLGAQGLDTIEMASGGCQRGTVDVSVPDGRSVTSVILTDSLLREIGRWQAGTGAPPTAPLTSPSAPTTIALGVRASLDGGANAAAFSVTPDAPPLNEFAVPPPGSTFSRLDVELCAGTGPLSVNPLYWYGVLGDNQFVSAALGAQGLQTIELAAGQCQRGTVDVAVPDGLAVIDVVLTDTALAEKARWAA